MVDGGVQFGAFFLKTSRPFQVELPGGQSVMSGGGGFILDVEQSVSYLKF